MKSSFLHWALTQLPFAAKTSLFAGLAVAASNMAACHKVGELVSDVFTDSSVVSQPLDHAKKTTPLAMQPTPELLADYHWTLTKAQKQDADIHTLVDVIAKGSVKMTFANNQLHYSVGCNSLSAPYQLTGDRLSIGAVIATQMLCPLALDEIERHFDKRFENAQLSMTVDADKKQATLVQVHGAEVLTWQGEMTHKARYGDPVVLFWEIAPQTVDCVNRQGESTSCLKVRNVNYDEQGVKVGSGAWRTFHGTIHGFEHNPKRKAIIRLNAYNNPNSDENPLYVFDTETEVEFLE